MPETLTQCTLVRLARKHNKRIHTMVTWIETKHAHFGTVVSLKEHPDDEHWQVTDIYATQAKSEIDALYSVLKQHRYHTDA